MLQQKIELSQQLKLTPQLMQSLNILALNQMELVEFVETLYTENPCVEISYSTSGTDEKYTSPIQHTSKTSQNQDEEDFDVINSMEDHSRENTLEEHLASQLNFSRLTQDQTGIIGFIINNLDENGFYPLTPAQTVAFIGKVTEQEVTHCLKLLQSLEPCGICCANLQECLCRQLEKEGETNPNFTIMIYKCLELFALGKYNSIQTKYHIPFKDITAFKQVITKLNPKPGAPFGSKSNSYIIPDIYVTDKGTELVPVLNDKYIPKVFVSDYYKTFSSPDDDTKKYIEHKISSAQWAIKCLEKRSETMLALAKEIIAANETFFQTGKGSLSCLRMQDVADSIGVHSSTISRCVRGKYIQCRYGTYLAKSFFSKSSAISDNTFTGPETDSELLCALREIVEQENKNSPYSDEKIADKMKENGYPIARRTVVKYRGILNIPSSVERRVR